jgi:hypothetical protein
VIISAIRQERAVQEMGCHHREIGAKKTQSKSEQQAKDAFPET